MDFCCGGLLRTSARGKADLDDLDSHDIISTAMISSDRRSKPCGDLWFTDEGSTGRSLFFPLSLPFPEKPLLSFVFLCSLFVFCFFFYQSSIFSLQFSEFRIQFV